MKKKLVQNCIKLECLKRCWDFLNFLKSSRRVYFQKKYLRENLYQVTIGRFQIMKYF